MSKLKEINDMAELDAVLKENDKVIIKIGTSSCGPCKLMVSNIESLMPKYTDTVFGEIDADECDNELIDHFAVRSIPVLIRFEKGEESKRFVGSMNVPDLETFIA